MFYNCIYCNAQVSALTENDLDKIFTCPDCGAFYVGSTKNEDFIMALFKEIKIDAKDKKYVGRYQRDHFNSENQKIEFFIFWLYKKK